DARPSTRRMGASCPVACRGGYVAGSVLSTAWGALLSAIARASAMQDGTLRPAPSPPPVGEGGTGERDGTATMGNAARYRGGRNGERWLLPARRRRRAFAHWVMQSAVALTRRFRRRGGAAAPAAAAPAASTANSGTD